MLCEEAAVHSVGIDFTLGQLAMVLATPTLAESGIEIAPLLTLRYR
jgi:hypothetical protein